VKISRSELKPGDLIFYSSSNRIDHVAIYIGNEQVVHAANTRDGIKISNAFYQEPVCYVRYLD
jgi:cell wall-associated NlpC family hydrolase